VRKVNPRPGGAGLLLIRARGFESQLELELVAQRDAELADGSDLRFQSGPRLVDGSGPDRDEPEAAPLVKTEALPDCRSW